MNNEGNGDKTDLSNLSKATELDFTEFNKDMLLKTCF